MADRKISDLTALTTPASGDYLPIVDISEAAAASKNKRITIEELMRGVPNGTAAAPGIAFETDPNTGIYSPGADQLAVATNGVGRLFISNTGVISTGINGAGSLVNGPSLTLERYSGSDLHSRWATANVSGGLQLQQTIGTASGGDNTARARVIFSAVSGTYQKGFQWFDDSGNTVLGYAPASGRIYLGDSTNNGTLSSYLASGTNIAGGTLTIAGGQGTGTGAGGPIVFATAAAGSSGSSVNALTERLRITSAGLVGIGTSAPAELLHVSGGNIRFGATGFIGEDASTSPASIRFGANPGATFSVPRDLEFYANIGANPSTVRMILKGQTGNVGIGDTAPNSTLTIKAATSVVPLRVSGPSSEFARIDTSGRLLVGTSTARANMFNATLSSAFQVEGTTHNTSSVSIVRNSNNESAAAFVIGKSRGAAAGGSTLVNNNDAIAYLSFQGADGSELVECASIACGVDGTPGANDMPGRLVFSTTADGSATPTERLRITSAGVLQVADAGNITVGTTTGTKIGTATTQKLGFYNATPVVQPTAVADATDAATAITQLNDLLAKLRTLGIIAT